MKAIPPGTLLRACAICDQPVLARAYQDNSARTCSPSCARELAVQEHPDLEQHRKIDLPPNGEAS